MTPTYAFGGLMCGNSALAPALALVYAYRCPSFSVPVSNLPQLVLETKEDLTKNNILFTIVGHVGDGNFHAAILFTTPTERVAVVEAVHRLVERAIGLDGTCTGEHGVGIGKKQYLRSELGEGTVRLMKRIKESVDPMGLFNPGKVSGLLPVVGYGLTFSV